MVRHGYFQEGCVSVFPYQPISGGWTRRNIQRCPKETNSNLRQPLISVGGMSFFWAVSKPPIDHRQGIAIVTALRQPQAGIQGTSLGCQPVGQFPHLAVVLPDVLIALGPAVLSSLLKLLRPRCTLCWNLLCLQLSSLHHTWQLV